MAQDTAFEENSREHARQSVVALGQTLRSLRKQRNLSQIELEEKSGICRNTIARAERDASSVTLFKLECICGALGVTVLEVLADAKMHNRWGREKAA